MKGFEKIRQSKILRNKTVKTAALTVLSAAFWIGVWYIAASAIGKEWILPAPHAVLRAFFESFEGGRLPLYLLKTTIGIGAGYLAGVLTGFLLAALTARVKALHILFSPLLTVVRATPVASFILILWVFLVRETVPAVAVSLIVTPILWGNCESGFLSADKQLKEVAQVYDFSFFKKVGYLYLPAVSPYFKAAALTSLGMAWKAGVAAEVLCTPEGTIGRMIWLSKVNIETADVMSWTLAVILTCFALEKLLKTLFARTGKKKKARKEKKSGDHG